MTSESQKSTHIHNVSVQSFCCCQPESVGSVQHLGPTRPHNHDDDVEVKAQTTPTLKSYQDGPSSDL